MRSPHKDRFKLLVVDDQAVDIAGLNFLAQTLGYSVTLAFDGEDAWQAATTQDFDLIILDWYMPNTPGWTFLKKLEQRANQSKTKRNFSENIVLHTAEPMSLDEFSNTTPFRILDIWLKPLGPADLLKKMNQVKQKLGA